MLTVTSVQVTDAQQLNFLPKSIGKWYLTAEQGICNVLRQFLRRIKVALLALL